MKYRSRIDITNLILKSTIKGTTKTKIMYKAYLSYKQVQEYLKYLQRSDLLTFEEETQLYRPTEKGFKYLNLSQELNEMVVTTN